MSSSLLTLSHPSLSDKPRPLATVSRDNSTTSSPLAIPHPTGFTTATGNTPPPPLHITNSLTHNSSNHNSSTLKSSARRFAEKRSWSAADDTTLLNLIAASGCNPDQISWTTISCQFTHVRSARSGKQCRERYANHLHPSVKKGGWTTEEDEKIRLLQTELGNQWAKMVKHLPGRSDNSIKNRFWSFFRSRQRENGSPTLGFTTPGPGGSSTMTASGRRAVSPMGKSPLALSPLGKRPSTATGKRKAAKVKDPVKSPVKSPVKCPVRQLGVSVEGVMGMAYSPGAMEYPPVGKRLGKTVGQYEFVPIVSPAAGNIVSFERPVTDRDGGVITPIVESVVELTAEDFAAADVMFNWPTER